MGHSIWLEDLITTRRTYEPAGGKYSNTLEEDIERWEEQVGIRHNPEDEAMAAHKRRLEEQGIEWDDTPVSEIPGLQDKMDQEIPGTFMGDPKDPGRRR